MLPENQLIFDQYFQHRVLGEETQKIYNRSIQSWDKHTGVPLIDLTKESLTTWYQIVKDSLGFLTIEKYGTQLRTLYAFTLEQKGQTKRRSKVEAQELFDVIPFHDLRSRAKKEENLRDKLVSPQEFQALMKQASHPRMKLLLSLTYESGCRKGEIFSLRLRDIQANDQYWNISVDGKTGTRTIPVISSIPYLKAWLQIHPDRDNENSPLFVAQWGGKVKPITPTSFNVGLRKLCKRAGIRMLYPHQLRHTRLTELAEGGVGEYQLKSFAGWTPNSAMANKYVHLSGKGHVNAVLEAGGVEVEQNRHESKPFIKLSRCPNCDRQVDSDMITCPYCQFILDDKMGIKHHNELEAMRAELEDLKKQRTDYEDLKKQILRELRDP